MSITGMSMEQVVAWVNCDGPARVIIDERMMVSPRRAERQYGIKAEIIFLRRDGWSLGAQRGGLALIAAAIWPDHWVGVLIPPGLDPISMEEYRSVPELDV